MIPRSDLPPALRRLLAVQNGVVTRQQCHEAGLGPKPVHRLVRAEVWTLVVPGIYRGCTGPATWDELAAAGVLHGGEGARLSGRSAAWLHGLTDAPILPIEVLTPGTVRSYDWLVARRERPGPRKASGPAWPPRLQVVDTVLDLCATGNRDDVVHWVTTAVQRRRTTRAALLRGLDHRRRLRHRQLIRDLVDDAANGVHSVLEHRYLHRVERAHGLPAGRRQRLMEGTGGDSDVAYEDYGVLVELDGFRWHSGRAAARRDRARDNLHSDARWKTYRYGWAEVDGTPCDVAAQVGRALQRRGWTGVLRSCAHCERSGSGPDYGRRSGT